MKESSVSGDFPDCWREFGLAEGEKPRSSERHVTLEMAKLCQTIEGDIIPRLLMVFDTNSGPAEMPAGPQVQTPLPPFTGDVEEFVQLLLNHDVSVAVQYITVLREEGARLKNIYLDLLAPAARHLGTLWDDDQCSFTQVTVGVSRMHQILHMFSPCFCAHESPNPDSGLTALIVPMPGDQHTFGHIMVVEFFRRAGWNVWSGAPRSNTEIIDLVAGQLFSIVGLSIGADRHLEDMVPLLASVRKHSLNKEIRILVGGRVFTDTDRIPSHYGADASAKDGQQAVRLATRLVEESP